MREIENIARQKGIDFPENIIDLTFQKAATFPFQTPTPLQLNVNSGKGKNELELFAGGDNFESQLFCSTFPKLAELETAAQLLR